jgi:hypothetical protein
MKDNAEYEVVERRAVPQNRNILRDEIIGLTGVGAWKKCPHLLRRIVVWDAENEREIVLLTNHLDFAPRPSPPFTRIAGRSNSSSRRSSSI